MSDWRALARQLPRGIDSCDNVLLNAITAVEEDHVRIWLENSEHDWARHAAKCVALSVDLETCQALMRGDAVPASRLDPRGMRAYGRRATSQR